mmetsp:Transcript_49644/g.103576  ORF Transcript_49644/g.103576 Transcript_49644/m.103576 type:complete len:121 (+) Transcript_49644:31-393(+)
MTHENSPPMMCDDDRPPLRSSKFRITWELHVLPHQTPARRDAESEIVVDTVPMAVLHCHGYQDWQRRAETWAFAAEISARRRSASAPCTLSLCQEELKFSYANILSSSEWKIWSNNLLFE